MFSLQITLAAISRNLLFTLKKAASKFEALTVSYLIARRGKVKKKNLNHEPVVGSFF